MQQQDWHEPSQLHAQPPPCATPRVFVSPPATDWLLWKAGLGTQPQCPEGGQPRPQGPAQARRLLRWLLCCPWCLAGGGQASSEWRALAQGAWGCAATWDPLHAQGGCHAVPLPPGSGAPHWCPWLGKEKPWHSAARGTLSVVSKGHPRHCPPAPHHSNKAPAGLPGGHGSGPWAGWAETNRAGGDGARARGTAPQRAGPMEKGLVHFTERQGWLGQDRVYRDQGSRR